MTSDHVIRWPHMTFDTVFRGLPLRPGTVFSGPACDIGYSSFALARHWIPVFAAMMSEVFSMLAYDIGYGVGAQM